MPKYLIIILNRGKGNVFNCNVQILERFCPANYVENDKYNYFNLIGVVSHFGESGMGGHFIAFCKHNIDGKWRCYNDSVVTECKNDYLQKGTPYILFYQKEESNLDNLFTNINTINTNNIINQQGNYMNNEQQMNFNNYQNMNNNFPQNINNINTNFEQNYDMNINMNNIQQNMNNNLQENLILNNNFGNFNNNNNFQFNDNQNINNNFNNLGNYQQNYNINNNFTTKL